LGSRPARLVGRNPGALTFEMRQGPACCQGF
jgi:hypothetical protein